MQQLTGTLCETANAAACDSPQPYAFFRHPVPRPLSAFNRVTLVDSQADSRYNGVFLELTKRYAKHFQL